MLNFGLGNGDVCKLLLYEHNNALSSMTLSIEIGICKVRVTLTKLCIVLSIYLHCTSLM